MGLKTYPKTVNVPGEIPAELVKERWMSQSYPSESAYIVGLIVFDIMCKRPHTITAELMRQPAYVRDKVITEIVAAYAEKESKPGGWLGARMIELAGEMIVEREARKKAEAEAAQPAPVKKPRKKAVSEKSGVSKDAA